MNNRIFTGKFLYAERLDDGMVGLCLDNKNSPVNALHSALAEELCLALDAINEIRVKGILLYSAKSAFLAGADIAALAELLEEPPEVQIRFCRNTAAALNRLADFPAPSVCAINGYALGGGLETALCTDYRVLAEDAVIGFPECGFGILPGVGGTVRTPRLTNLETAIDWLTSARNYPAKTALKAGMVDVVAPEKELRDTALAFLKTAIAGNRDWQTQRAQCRSGFAINKTMLDDAKAQSRQQLPSLPARHRILDLLGTCAALDRDHALSREADAFAELAQTDTAKALVGNFQSNQQLRKKVRTLAANTASVERAAVLGAGIMGGGIAYTSAVKGTPVVLRDISQQALDQGISEALKLLSKQVNIGRLSQPQADACLESISPTLSIDELNDPDIIVEAVVENLAIKQAVLADVQASTRDNTVLASNTSSLLIADIARGLQRPEQLIGMHFFNPVPVMPLVEIIRSEYSSDAAVATAVSYALAMGKTPLVVRDCSGFLINRILGAYFTAFNALIHDGTDFEQIDRVMQHWGWPMGPAYLLDVAGLDTLDKAMAVLGKAYPDVMATDYPTAIAQLADRQWYGQKNGLGFYQYEPDDRGRPKKRPHDEAKRILAGIQRDIPIPGEEEIQERMMLAMMLEADRCLNEGIAESAADIDTGMRLATGFPAHHGGPLWYADRLGLSQLIARCNTYQSIGGLYQPSEQLQRRARNGEWYYPRPA